MGGALTSLMFVKTPLPVDGTLPFHCEAEQIRRFPLALSQKAFSEVFWTSASSVCDVEVGASCALRSSELVYFSNRVSDICCASSDRVEPERRARL